LDLAQTPLLSSCCGISFPELYPINGSFPAGPFSISSKVGSKLGFATVQDSLTFKYQIIADGNIVPPNAGRPSTILTMLQALDSKFHDL
jgi:hypothetical protein